MYLRAAVALETATEDDTPRLVAVVGIVRELGRLKDKAARAEKALVLRRLSLGEHVEIDPALRICAFMFAKQLE